ncbi:hypothetical protein J2X36_005262 [Methylobacterium sp. BE186]|uniref:hypothetical protein n=1 Tax=Methylobacterium sp. BE186 TaxID=2817715 RepID=UPI0028678B2A|nr:hypothetical protein [Methylobacterium sp. BE186]MDR7040479.1 hypothetical protein [Methylobacterium sp. BE186]
MDTGEVLTEHVQDMLDLEAAAKDCTAAAPKLLPRPETERPRVNPGHAMMGAARIRAEAHGPDPFADRCEAQAREKLPAERVRPGAGSELVPMAQAAEDAALVLVDTLEKPDYVAADASRERLDLLNDAGALTIGLDTADTMEARDSLERMLAHQLAALHVSTMKLAQQLNRATERLDVAGPDPRKRAAANVEACRLVGAVSRISSTYQAGLGTLQRLRTGGKQTFVFQHNHVTDGGQAVIGGMVEGGRGAPKRKRGSK